MNTSKKDKKTWHPQQEVLLQEWAEMSSGYRWLHDRSYRAFKKQSLGFTIPVIIMSTVTGTANFAQESFPDSWSSYVPMIIGFVNLVAAIITTISQFLKINELMEGSRVASISFGKLTRNITVELNLPHNERNNEGADFLRLCQSEFDRLIEQSPAIPKNTLMAYKLEFEDRNICQTRNPTHQKSTRFSRHRGSSKQHRGQCSGHVSNETTGKPRSHATR